MPRGRRPVGSLQSACRGIMYLPGGLGTTRKPEIHLDVGEPKRCVSIRIPPPKNRGEDTLTFYKVIYLFITCIGLFLNDLADQM